MTSVFARFWRFVTGDVAGRAIHVTIAHPVFGTIEFNGTRSPRDNRIDGLWKVPLPGSTRGLTVDFRSIPPPSPDNVIPPPAEDLARLEALLGDLDALFERGRSRLAAQYERTVEEPMPADWRSVFRLDSISLPDPDDEEQVWDVSYWCENAQHWFNVVFQG
jgi:hypothetical protein